MENKRDKNIKLRYVILLQFLILTTVLWFFSDWSREYFKIFLLSVLEFRIAIVAALHDHLSIQKLFLIPFLGGMAITLLVGFLLPIIEYFFSKNAFLHNFLQKKLAKKREKHSQKMEKLGKIMIFLFVATPLPGAGPLGGIIIAEIFNVPYLQALGLISSGYILSLFITAILSISGYKLWEILVV